MHFQSYMNKMPVSLIVDPTIISDTHRLLNDDDNLIGDKRCGEFKGSSYGMNLSFRSDQAGALPSSFPFTTAGCGSVPP
ncbi:hypothetical protein YC2023_002698 [Brassica napus]